MRILFLHQNFPAQFVHVARELRKTDRHQLLALVPKSNPFAPLIPTRYYAFDPGIGSQTSPLANHFMDRVARATAAAISMRELASEGFTPDLVVGHCGWGETLFVKDIWPGARLIVHAEFYYAAEGADVGFDPEFPLRDPVSSRMHVRTRNTAVLQAVMDADQAISPTAWQAASFPSTLQSKIAIAHEGIDTDRVRPNGNVSIKLQRPGLTLRPGDEVVTFIARNLEPYRGYHIFMRSLSRILSARPNARVVIVGGDGVSYGAAAPDGVTWKEHVLREVAGHIDMSRIHFVGRVPYPVLLNVMQVSAVHIYLTYPFVLSWSLLEAMSAGALVVGSRTAPVEEVIVPDQNGILCDFFDADGIADAVIGALAQPERFRHLREAARRSVVERFDLKRVCLPAWLDFLCP
jgi:glycosyltransferase involved in cell wall biosynthesis